MRKERERERGGEEVASYPGPFVRKEEMSLGTRLGRRRKRERENEGERKERRMDRLSFREVRLQSKLSHMYMHMSYPSPHLVDEE